MLCDRTMHGLWFHSKFSSNANGVMLFIQTMIGCILNRTGRRVYPSSISLHLLSICKEFPRYTRAIINKSDYEVYNCFIYKYDFSFFRHNIFKNYQNIFKSPSLWKQWKISDPALRPQNYLKDFEVFLKICTKNS